MMSNAIKGRLTLAAGLFFAALALFGWALPEPSVFGAAACFGMACLIRWHMKWTTEEDVRLADQAQRRDIRPGA